MSNSFGTGIAGGLLCYVLVQAAGRPLARTWGLVVLALPLGYFLDRREAALRTAFATHRHYP